MDDRRVVIEALNAGHDRGSFSCGEPALDAYLQRQASQDMKRRVAQVFVALGETRGSIAGYYGLSSTSFRKEGLPPELSKRLPHYPVPAAIIGRLAVDRARQGTGLGALLLIDAMRRVLAASERIAVNALIVDTKNERAQAFYERYGFRPFVDEQRRLYLPLETIAKLNP